MKGINKWSSLEAVLNMVNILFYHFFRSGINIAGIYCVYKQWDFQEKKIGEISSRGIYLSIGEKKVHFFCMTVYMHIKVFGGAIYSLFKTQKRVFLERRGMQNYIGKNSNFLFSVCKVIYRLSLQRKNI